MTAAVGYPTLRLVRWAIGPLTLGTVTLGECVPLSPTELRALRTATELAAPGGKPGRRQDDARGRKPKTPARSKPRPPANRRQRRADLHRS